MDKPSHWVKFFNYIFNPMLFPLGFFFNVAERPCNVLAIKKHVELIEIMYYEHLRRKKYIYEKKITLIMLCFCW